MRRSLTGLWSRRAALVLALFFGSFTIVYGSFGVLGDLFPGFLSWGYVFGLIALAAMIAALVCLRSSARRPGGSAGCRALLGALASLLHPWQGELLILHRGRRRAGHVARREPLRRRLRLPALTARPDAGCRFCTT